MLGRKYRVFLSELFILYRLVGIIKTYNKNSKSKSSKTNSKGLSHLLCSLYFLLNAEALPQARSLFAHQIDKRQMPSVKQPCSLVIYFI